MMLNKTRMKNRGVALITVLLIVALAAIIATQMTARLQLQMQRTANIDFNQQAYWYAMSAEAFTKRVLLQTFKDEPEVTHLGQIWAQGETRFPVDYGQITGEIIDLHACFNLNALYKESQSDAGSPPASPPAEPTGGSGTVKKPDEPKDMLKRLIVSLGVEGVSDFEAESMVDALTDWLDENSSISSASGAEDNDYAAKKFPYLPANNMLASINELRVIEHFTVAVIEKLTDYVCVLPNNNLHKFNINTLDGEKPELLAALFDIPQNDAEQILSAREEEGYEDIADFFSTTEVSKLNLADDFKELFEVKSEYFALKTTTSFNNSFFALTSMLQVSDKGKKVTVISRSVGRF